MSLKFHHIAIASDSIQLTSSIFSKLGFLLDEQFIDKIQDVKIKFVKNENIQFELVEPLGNNSPINNIIKKNGVTPYHICFTSDNFEVDIEFLKKLGFIEITDKKEAIAFNNKNIIFLYHKNFGLIELIDER